MADKTIYSGLNAAVTDVTATIMGESYQIADIDAAYIERRSSLIGSLISVGAIVAVVGTVLLPYGWNAYTSIFNPTFRQRHERLIMAPGQIAERQFLDLLLPVGIVALLIIGLVVLRKAVAHYVLVLEFNDGSSKAIEGLERSEAEEVREVIEKLIEPKEISGSERAA